MGGEEGMPKGKKTENERENCAEHPDGNALSLHHAPERLKTYLFLLEQQTAMGYSAGHHHSSPPIRRRKEPS